ncbi:hypothetical protein ES332_D03G069100v1 [Gossypium tomentosum]|uniref:Uncharacterized protein n=1 Tax=Gossypium tomentosum TaxID=34277 RepID=A0A5D2LJH3_GOSTO|nr:hypothetical protein ES332_D03G069100v1 [Gossypium tomentosum]
MTDWVHFGDHNMKFFHNKALIRWNSNKISVLKIGDNYCYANESLHDEAVRFFSSLFSLDDLSCVAFPLCGHFSYVDCSTMDSLTLIVNVEEVRSVLFSMGPLKAPSLDAFHFLFYQIQ